MAGRSHRQVSSRRITSMGDEVLLRTRLCDFDVSLKGTMAAACIDRLNDELGAAGIGFRPHTWMSSEWFSPDGVPGVAIPFYLAHPRLARLERKMMFEVEGGTERTCMRILRHEAGHAICTAHRLHHRKRWRRLFGRFSQAYPETYHVVPDSRDFVLHFDAWYAQAHPAEDFAETFAVWLAPASRWRQQYTGWPVMQKLDYVDEIMAELGNQPAPIRSRRHIEPLHQLRMTLGEHYRQKQLRFADEWPDFYDRDLRRVFSADSSYRDHESAAVFLRRVRSEVRQLAAEATGQHPYTIDQVLRDMIDRCRELNLRRIMPERESRMQIALMVTVQTMNHVHGGHLHFPL